jgi:very-short-patch-repair endonuclease
MVVLDAALVLLARAQCGVFSSAQAHRFGLSNQDLSRLARRGLVVRLGHGSYALPQALDGLDPTARFVQLVRGVVLARPVRSWASHHAALAVHGLPLHEVDTAAVDVCGTVTRRSRSSRLEVHPLPQGEPCQLVRGIRVVSAELAVVQVSARSVAAGLVAVDAALHTGLVDEAAIAAAIDRALLGPRQRARVAAVLAMSDPRCESPGESLTRVLLVGLGLPVRSQVNVRDRVGLIGRVDFLVGDRVVVEFDGMVKYGGADGREALAAEKRREDRLRTAGYEVVRLTWADLHQPEHVARTIRQAMARAAAR